MTADDTNGPISDETDQTTVRESTERTPHWSTSRRAFLQTVSVGALLGAVGTGNALASLDTTEFIETDGTEFVVGDRPIYFNGTNNFWIADPYASRQRVEEFISLCAELNMTLVRTWAFCSGGGGHCLQPEPGVYDEAGFQHLDHIIDAARTHGVRLVLPLVNNWSDYGGMAQYVSWSESASSHDDFYVDSETQQLYHDFIEYVLTRENTITGVEYRNEPAIAIWELANEPRAKQATDGIARVTQWIEETSSLIKDLDPNHLVSTGMEGFYDKGGDDWRHDGSHGTAFIDQHQIDTIDACSFHLYPDHWPGIDPAVPQDGVDWITEHVGDAFETVGKPVYLGEFGISLHENSQSVRDSAFAAYYDALDQHDANGAMVWELVRDAQSNHDGFAVYQDESSMTAVNEFTAVQSEKSGGNGSENGDPAADLVGPDTLYVGETGSFDASGSSDTDGSISSYEWDFDDGTTATGVSVTHAYADTGEYRITLTVTDDDGATDEATATVSVTDDATAVLVINDYDGSPAWADHRNDLDQWCGAGSFANGGGTVENGALVLEYDNGGWFQEQINRDITEYESIVLRVRGANGGEESEFLFDMGGVRTLLSNVTSDSITTSYTDVAVDLRAAGVDRAASSLSLRFNFWQGGSSTLEIETIRLE